MSFGLSDIDIEKIKNVFGRFPQIEQVIIYGSRAMGNYRPNSDIDLTVKGLSISLDILNKITQNLDDLLLPYLIDISNFKQLDNPEFINHIERVGKVFYQKI
jgi:predicted nucleotidyltransferase